MNPEGELLREEIVSVWIEHLVDRFLGSKNTQHPVLMVAVQIALRTIPKT